MIDTEIDKDTDLCSGCIGYSYFSAGEQWQGETITHNQTLKATNAAT